MIINVILLLIILFSLGGIIYIVGRKLFYLANIDLSQIPEEVMARTKKELVKRKINRQISEFRNKLKTKINHYRSQTSIVTSIVKNYFKKTLDFLKKLR